MGPLAAFAASITWAWASNGYSRLAKHNSAFAVSFVRSLIGLPLFITLAVVTGGFSEYFNATLSNVGWFTLSAIASYGFADALFLFSTRSLGVPGALAVTATYPIWTALFGFFFKNEVLKISQTLGLIITIISVVIVVLTTPPTTTKNSKKSLFVGLSLALCTSVLWAVNGYAVSQGTLGISLPVANTLRMACALFVTPVFALLFLPRASLLIPRQELKPELKYFVGESFLGSMCFTYGLSNSPLAIGSTLSSLAPVVAVPMAWIAKTEKVTFVRTAGIIGVVAGLALLMSGK